MSLVWIKQNPELYPADAEKQYLDRLNGHIQSAREAWASAGMRYMLKHCDAQLKPDGIELFIPSDMAPELDMYMLLKCPGCESTGLDKCDVCQRPKPPERKKRR